MIDSFHCPGNSSVFQMELQSLLISERIVVPPDLISSAGILSLAGYLCLFSFTQRRPVQVPGALLYALLST